MKHRTPSKLLKKSNSQLSENSFTIDNDLLLTDGMWFKDQLGRVITLRGVNLSGATKLPAEPCMTSHRKDGFFDHRNVSFVGRPFPLADADEHLQRLHAWGFNFLRFIVTWEAIEHAGPGKYDVEYFDYVVQVLLKAKKFGFRCFIDPHQDVWSRFTGGSGAPGWTLDLVGFDMEKFAQTGAAIVHNTFPEPEKFPRMIWPTNYSKLACSTMFTLFFGGKQFAPRALVDINTDMMKVFTVEEYKQVKSSKKMLNIQDYLQMRYCNAISALLAHISKTEGLLDTVIAGCDTMNEPSGGYLGLENITEFSKHTILKNGDMPTAFQSMLLGQGIACEVEVWDFGPLGPRKKGKKQIDPQGVSCWKSGYSCIWEAHGLYDSKSKTALNTKHFFAYPGTDKEVDWIHDCWKPFVRLYTKAIRSVFENSIIFIEPPVNEIPPLWDGKSGDPIDRICFTPHWYDGITLMNKHFSSWWTIDYTGYTRGQYSNILAALNFGIRGIKSNFSKQLGFIKSEGLANIGETPFLLGEFGIPYDMDGKKSYKSGNYRNQVKALDANFTAVERNNLNVTLWNYCADNNNQWGDNWNGEDLSIFSRDTIKSESENSASKRARVDLTPMIGSQQAIDSKAKTSGGGRNRRLRKTVDTSVTMLASEDDKSKAESIRSEATVGSRNHSRSNTTPELRTTGRIDSINEGGRAIAAFLRPYPMKANGIPFSLSFDMNSKSKEFKFVLKSTSSYISRKKGAGTEIFVPSWHFGRPLASVLHENSIAYDYTYFTSNKDKCKLMDVSADDFYFDVKISSGSWTFDEEKQVLHWFHGNSKESTEMTHEIQINVLSKKEVCRRASPSTERSFCSII